MKEWAPDAAFADDSNRYPPEAPCTPIADSVHLPTILRRLNEALATEIACVMRYRRHHDVARCLHATAAAEEFMAHSEAEQRHADLIARRIVQLGGEPEFSPDEATQRHHSALLAGESLLAMMREDLFAERLAIDRYRRLIDYLGDHDPDTRQMLSSIMRMEEAHAHSLAQLLEQI